MVEHAIEQYADSALSRLLDKLTQVVLGAEAGVYFRVVNGVIAVIGGRGEDGGEIDAGDAKLFNIIKLFYHAPQVAAVEIAALRWVLRQVAPLEMNSFLAVYLVEAFTDVLEGRL